MCLEISEHRGGVDISILALPMCTITGSWVWSLHSWALSLWLRILFFFNISSHRFVFVLRNPNHTHTVFRHIDSERVMHIGRVQANMFALSFPLVCVMLAVEGYSKMLPWNFKVYYYYYYAFGSPPYMLTYIYFFQYPRTEHSGKVKKW